MMTPDGNPVAESCRGAIPQKCCEFAGRKLTARLSPCGWFVRSARARGIAAFD